jgi:hypothetical protein
LDGDGINEVLLSIARDRNGKQGNCWNVYKTSGEGFTYVGGITFSGRALFLGPVDELHSYGLVTFWSAGAGEGQMIAYTIDKGKVQETKIGALERIDGTDRMRGQRLFDKYANAGQGSVLPPIQEIHAREFVPRYGLPVEPITYAESFSLDPVPVSEKSSLSESKPSPAPVSVDAAQDAVATALMLPQSGNGPLPQDLKPSVESGSVARLPLSVGRDIFLSVVLVGLLTGVHLWRKGRKASAGR